VTPGRDLVLVADVHVDAVDDELRDFLAFLDARAADTAVLVLLGDIFSLWLGREKFTLPHHRAVLEACSALRARGVRVVFVEGNREFGAGAWTGRAFDDVADRVAVEPWSGRRWFLAHGDLLNRDDRVNRLFRWWVRSPAVLGLFGLLPARVGLRAGAAIERHLRHRNLRHKTSLPRERFARYGAWLAGRGFDAGAIGHVHVEMELDVVSPHDGRSRSLYVLPDWRTTRRSLRIPREGAPRFEGWGELRDVPPAVIGVEERPDATLLRFDRPVPVGTGAEIRIDSGHGSGSRVGHVLEPAEPDRSVLRVQLSPGPPIQVGDRLVAGAAEHTGDSR
jgi:UDP-2,3-diacylglucosamine hydrolase